MENISYGNAIASPELDIKMLKQQNGFLRINNPAHSRPIVFFFLAFTALAVVSLSMLGIDWYKIIERSSNLTKVITALAELDFTDIDIVIPAFLDSVWVAVLGTFYSLIMGLFFGIFMARNIAPIKWLSPVLSSVFTMIRAIPTAVWVLLFLVCLGFGPAPGIAGVCLHSTAFFARAFSQCFEEVPEATLEALKAMGANRIKVFFSAILPSSLTSIIAWSAMNFELNFAASSILGMVGAGGIGYIISASFHAYKYDRAMVAIILVFVFSYILEMSLTTLKHRLKV